MPVSEGYLDYVLERLGLAGEVEARRMFGGAGIYSGGVCFALVADDTLYLKVDESNRGEFEAAGSTAFSPFGTYTMSYYELPADVLEDESRLVEWARGAIAAAERAPAHRRGRGRGA